AAGHRIGSDVLGWVGDKQGFACVGVLRNGVKPAVFSSGVEHHRHAGVQPLHASGSSSTGSMVMLPLPALGRTGLAHGSGTVAVGYRLSRAVRVLGRWHG